MIKKYYELLQTTINFDFINLFRANVIPNLSLVEYVHKDEKPFFVAQQNGFYLTISLFHI